MGTSFTDWDSELAHYGIPGMKWGVRRYQNPDGTLTAEGKRHYSGEVMFVSGSSKTQDKQSAYYRRKLPKFARQILKSCIKKGDTVIVGDAPGIDRQVQEYLKKKHYDNVEVYGPGKQVRYSANKRWKTNPVDAPEYAEGSKEWLAKKDIAMTERATKGLAIILDEGSKATRKNVERLIEQNKEVRIYELSPNNALIRGGKGLYDQEVVYGKRNEKGKYDTFYQGMKYVRKQSGKL